ncbi:MAG TPA: hypothetical protein VGE53_00335 [Candidatus Paceibacterota bacterium]
MNRTFTILIGIVFLIGVLGFLYFLTPNQPTPAPEAQTEASAYTSDAHGFSLSYPENLSILEYTDDMASIGTPIEGGIDSVADVRAMVLVGEPGESLQDTAARELANLCAADGPTGSFSCTGVKSAVPFVTNSGMPGFEIYLTGALTELPSGTVTEVDRGPFYAFVLETGATATKVLIVHAPLNKSVEESDADAIRAIAKTVSR